MKVKDIEAMVIDYCKRGNIQIVRGNIAEEHVLKVKKFLETMKKSYQNRRRMEKKQPTLIKDIDNGTSLISRQKRFQKINGDTFIHGNHKYSHNATDPNAVEHKH